MNTFTTAWAEVLHAQQQADAAILQLNNALGTTAGLNANIPALTQIRTTR